MLPSSFQFFLFNFRSFLLCTFDSPAILIKCILYSLAHDLFSWIVSHLSVLLSSFSLSPISLALSLYLNINECAFVTFNSFAWWLIMPFPIYFGFLSSVEAVCASAFFPCLLHLSFFLLVLMLLFTSCIKWLFWLEFLGVRKSFRFGQSSRWNTIVRHS